MIRVGILGATGYTALEAIKILLRHPEVEITTLTSRQEGTPHIASIHPQLTARLDLYTEPLDPNRVGASCDCVFSCLPHCNSAEVIPAILAAGARVVDFSADYRLADVETYQTWYGEKHPDPERLGKVPYGLPELFRDQIMPADLVANPGCYPTSAILPLVPLLKLGLIEPAGIVIDSKSGVSGAGRTPKLTTLYPECNESISAYNVGRHRHTPEIDQIIGMGSGKAVETVFTPHLVPMDRGILTTTYSQPSGSESEESLLEAMKTFYADEPFIRVVNHLPATKDVMGTNFCDITVRWVRGKVMTISCIDNLIKGASGAAVQNMNLMFDFPETMAL
jgi:N-acetyl-gamma-glutamyl-phosphate reductase